MSLPIVARWLRRPAIAAAVIVTGSLLAAGAATAQTYPYVAPTYPYAAQTYPYADCNNPYYYQYCQSYAAWYNQYYAPYDYGYGYAYPYSYYPSYGYGVPAALGLGFGFHRFHHFNRSGGFNRGSGGHHRR